MTTKETNMIMKDLAEWIRLKEQADEMVERLKTEIKDRMLIMGVDTLTSDEHKATYKAVTSNRLDTVALKRENPELTARYTVSTMTTRFTFN